MIDVHAYEASLEMDVLDSRRGVAESTVRTWDKQRRQGRQRRNLTVAPVARSTVRFAKRPLVRSANVISSARPR
jgi:hypothetical protein